ncbi:MAG: hypothetical protein WC560_02945 [Syntrophales bacterium]
MDLILICRDALANSLVGNLVLAMEAKKAGTDVGVIITEEALAAMTGGTFCWPRELKEQVMRYKMADNAAAVGLTTQGGRGDGRQINLRQLITAAKEAGVPMFACPVWTALLGLKGNLPEGIKEVELPEALKMITEAKKVIGSF